MDNDTNGNGRSSNGSRQKSNSRSRSSTNPESITPQTLTSSSTSTPPLSRIVSSPALINSTSPPPTTAPPLPHAQPKPRRGLFSLLASAAQPPPAPPKSEASSHESNASSDAPPAPQPQPSFMQSLARRLSGSSNKKQFVETKNPAPQCPRRTLNVNHVRPRPEIKELEKIQLRRVCFVADETLISKRVFRASDSFETELPREPKLKVRDLREVYYRSSNDREVIPDDRIGTAFSLADGIELRKLDLSNIKFLSRESVLPICDTLSLVRGLEEVVLDYCELTDEQLRLLLAALLCLKPRPSESENEHARGVARLSLAGNNTLGLGGWRTLAYFVHMNADLVSLNISYIPMSMDAALILARAIALPNPARREIPPEFRLQPIQPKPRQRKFSFRRGSTGSIGVDLGRVVSPTTKRLNEGIVAIEEKPDIEEKFSTELPDIPPHTPITPTFVNMLPSTESSSIVVIEPPSGVLQPESRPRPPPRRKVEDLRMNHCDVSTDMIELFMSAVTEGGVRYWDIGGNKFDSDGMKRIAGLFTEPTSELVQSKQEGELDNGRASLTPPSSMLLAPASSVSLALEEPAPSTSGKLEYLSFEGTDLSSHQFDPVLDVWLNHPNPNNLSLWALDLTDCRLGRDLTFFTNLFKALHRFPNLRLLYLQHNPLFANPRMMKVLRDWLPRLPVLRRLNLASTGLEAQHLVELSRILPEVKSLVALNITDNPIYEVNDVQEEREGQTEDVSGLTALDAAMRYCPQIIELELPEGGGVETARLRHKIFLRCFKNIECLDHAADPDMIDDLSESGLGGRKRSTTEEAKDLPQPQTKEGHDKYEVDRGHGVARALETVLLNVQPEDKAQDMSLDLLHRAKKIKERLQPALVKGNRDKATLRRLTFLNQVLAKVIDRFEEAFPESCNIPRNPQRDHDPDSSDEDEEIDEEDKEVNELTPSPTLRKSRSMTELARGLELEEGDVHRFGSFMKKRNLIGVETDLTGEQLLEAILQVDKETVEREVWDKDGLRKVLRRSLDAGSSSTKPDPPQPESVGEQFEKPIGARESVTVKKDSDSHSI